MNNALMSGGVRGLVFAAIAVLLLIAFGEGWMLGASDQPQEQRYETYRQPASKPQGANATTAAGTEPQPFEYRTPCDNPEGREESDLCAQWKAANAASDAAFWAKWGFWIAFVGSTLLLWQIMLTRQAVEDTSEATEAMREANRIAKDAAIKDGRAWLKVTPQISSALEYLPDQDELRATFTLKIENIGGSPATDVGADVRLLLPEALRTKVDARELSEEMRSIAPANQFPRAIIFPNDSLDLIFTVSTPPGRMNEIKAIFEGHEIDGDGRTWIPQLTVIGCIQYSVLGSPRPHQTNFNYGIERVPTQSWGGGLVLEHLPLPREQVRLRYSVDGAGNID